MKYKIEEKIQYDVSLKDHTTFKVGGKAKYFLIAESRAEVEGGINWALQNGAPFFILGGGSNVLASDKGFVGLVLKIKNQEVSIRALNRDSKIISVAAGLPLADLVGLAQRESLTGLEWAAGILGTVGGAIYGNAGAFSGSMSDIVRSVETLEIIKRPRLNLRMNYLNYEMHPACHSEGVERPKNLNEINGRDSSLSPASNASRSDAGWLRMTSLEAFCNLKIKNFSREECCFSYRDSIFKKNKSLVIINILIELKSGMAEEIQKKTRDFLIQKAANQPLRYPSAGSIFKNAPLEPRLLKKFPELSIFKEKGLIPAAWLIEQSGLKGKKAGGAEISDKHAGFIVNSGQATAVDVKKLIDSVKKKVKVNFSIDLQEEIQYLGF